MDDFQGFGLLAALVVLAAGAVIQFRRKRRRHRHWLAEFHSAMSDATTRGAVVANFQSVLETAETVKSASSRGARRDAAIEDMELLHGLIAHLMIAEGQLADAEAHVREVPEDVYRYGSGRIVELLRDAKRALEAAKKLRTAPPLR